MIKVNTEKIYILDINPTQAAKDLTKVHKGRYVKFLQATFICAHSRGLQYLTKKIRRCVIKGVYYSRENYLWFSEFYEAIMKQINYKVDLEGFDTSFLYNTEGINFKGSGLKLPNGENMVDSEGIEKLILKNRIEYIKRDYNTQDFIGGYPSWYMLEDKVILDVQDNHSNIRLKIVADSKNNYRYYVARYFNKWEEITNFPKEMNYFIKYLIRK